MVYIGIVKQGSPHIGLRTSTPTDAVSTILWRYKGGRKRKDQRGGFLRIEKIILRRRVQKHRRRWISHITMSIKGAELNPGLNLFRTPPTDVSMVKYRYVKISPQTDRSILRWMEPYSPNKWTCITWKLIFRPFWIMTDTMGKPFCRQPGGGTR